MTTVYLYGHLGRKFGHRWSLDVSSPAEAVRAIIANRPDFHAYMIQHSAPGYQVFVGAYPVRGADRLGDPIGRQAIKIVPVLAGAAKDPTVQIIVGALILIAAVVTFQYEFIPLSVAMMAGSIGAGLAVGGISQLLAGTPQAPGISEKEANRPSFLFNGVVNTTAQGHPVPVGYGRMRVGSAVISAGITTEDLAP
jgi:predicted phage tail protein